MKNKAVFQPGLWVLAVFSLLGALSLCMRFAPPGPEEISTGSRLSEIFENFQYSLTGQQILLALLVAALMGLGLYCARLGEGRMRLMEVVCFLIALVWLTGKSFSLDDTLGAVSSSIGQMIKSVIYVFGSTYLLICLGYLLHHAFCRGLSAGKASGGMKKGDRLTSAVAARFAAHPFGAPCISLILLYLPHLLVYYPGRICHDAINQLSMYFGYSTFTTHHPPVMTLLMGAFIRFGNALGSANFGLFLFTLLQTVTLAMVLAYAFALMQKMHVPAVLMVISFLVAAFCPYYMAYVGVMLKDNLYSYMMLLFTLEMLCLLRMGKAWFFSPRHVILMILSITLAVLFRNNGSYVLYPTLAALLVYLAFVWRKERGRGKLLLRAAITFVLPILLSAALSHLVIRVYDVHHSSDTRDAFSLVFQQTARYVKYHGDDVRPEEREAIDKILAYDKLADRYDPKISDPVKNTFRTSSTGADFAAYLKAWFSMFLRHPMVYLEATLNQNYYVLYPGVENDRIHQPNFPNSKNFRKLSSLNLHTITVLKPFRTLAYAVYKSLFYLPVLGLLSHPAFYNLLLIFFFIYAIYERKGKWLMLSIPLILSDAVVILSPVFQGHPRYAFPVIYAMPVMAAFYLSLHRDETRNED